MLTKLLFDCLDCLLRRIGSTIYAGRQTTEKMLNEWGTEESIVNASLFEEEDDAIVNADRENMKNITDAERSALSRCLKALDASQDRDRRDQAAAAHTASLYTKLGDFQNELRRLENNSEEADKKPWFGSAMDVVLPTTLNSAPLADSRAK